jgi:hypothetical protein
MWWSRVSRPVKGVLAGVGVVIALLVMLRMTGYSVSLRSPGGDRAAITSLQEIELQRLDALVDADMSVLERVHADDFEAVPPTGERLTRQALLEAVATGDLDFEVYRVVGTIDVRLTGESAVLWYRSHIEVTATGLGRFVHDTWHTCRYEKRGGRWQIVGEQATAVGGFPPPTQSP